jgi:hypothetical protein
MALSVDANAYILTAAADTIPGRVRVRKILMTQTAGAGGAITIRQSGAAGLILFDGATVLNDTIEISYGGKGYDIKDLYIDTIPASAQVIVQMV